MKLIIKKINQKIIINDDIVVTIVNIKGDQVKLGIKAPSDITVYREEVYKAILKEMEDINK